MEKSSYDHGVPSWIDIGVPDVAKASAFYRDLLGWEVQEGPPETGGYRLALLRGLPVAGIGPQQDPNQPPAWTTYVNVDDADDVAARVTANGGQVLVPPMDVLNLGRMAIFADPAGAVFGIWQPGEMRGAGVVNEPGSWCWNELIADDIEAAKAFYGAVLGWEAHTSEGPMPYTEFQVGGSSIAGMLPRPPGMPREIPPYWGVYFVVADLDAGLARLADLGGQRMTEPMAIPAGRFATVNDPDGAVFTLMQLPEGAST